MDLLMNYEASLKAFLHETDLQLVQLGPAVRRAITRQNSVKARMLLDGHKRLQAQKTALQERLNEVLAEKRRINLTTVKNPMN